MELKQIPLDKILANFSQPREHFDKEKIQELAESILSNGLINPISIRVWKDKYMIVAGERRFRACKIAGLNTIQAFVKEYKNDIDWQIESLVENWQREDLTSVEKENNVYTLWKTNKFKTHKELAKKLGVNEVSIAQIIRAKEDRQRTKAAFGIKTRTITDTEGLEDKERKQIFDKVEKGKLKSQNVREVVRVIKQSQPEVKKALLDDKISVEQAERISKLQKPEQRTKAIQEHKNINMVEEHVERNIKNVETAREKREFDKRLIQVKNWIASLRYSITDTHSAVEKSLKLLLVNAKLYIPIMDDEQKEKFNEQLDRLLEILERGEHIVEQIKEKTK